MVWFGQCGRLFGRTSRLDWSDEGGQPSLSNWRAAVATPKTGSVAKRALCRSPGVGRLGACKLIPPAASRRHTGHWTFTPGSEVRGLWNTHRQRSGEHASCGRSHHRAISGTHGRCTAFLVPAASEVSASALRCIAYLAFVHRHTAHSALVLVHIAALGGRSGVLAFILEFGVAWVTRLHVRC